MGKYALLFPRLVNNAQLLITQTAKVCPKQLLDAALLAPPLLPRDVASPPTSQGTPESPILASLADSWRSTAVLRNPQIGLPNSPKDQAKIVSDLQRSKAQRTWAILEMRAVAALPSLSPAGILQFLFLAQRGNCRPQHFLAELRRFMLEGEPAAAPVDTFWLLWTANDLALFCKLLAESVTHHRADEAALVEKLLSQVAANLSYFSPEDAALVLWAAAVESSSCLREALLLQRQAATGEAARRIEGPKACQASSTSSTPGAPAFETGDSRPCKPGIPLFVLLLQRLASQLQEADLNDCMRAFFAASRICAGPLSQGVSALSPPLHSGSAAPPLGAISAALEPLRLLTQHLRCNLSTASASAKLRIISSSIHLLHFLSQRKGPRGVSLQEAVATAVNAAAGVGLSPTTSLELLPNGSAESGPKPSTGKRVGNPICAKQAKKVAVLKTPLFALSSTARRCRRAVNSDPYPAGVYQAAAAAQLEEALLETLAATISSLCSSPGDMKATEGMVLLELVWHLRMHYSFPVTLACLEGVYFYLLANIHQLSASDVVALTASFELCHSTDSEETNCGFEGQLPGDVAQKPHMQRHLKQLANLLRRRIHAKAQDRTFPLNDQERFVIQCLLEFSRVRQATPQNATYAAGISIQGGRWVPTLPAGNQAGP